MAAGLRLGRVMPGLVCRCAVGSEARLAWRCDGVGVTCAMLTNDNFVLVSGHGAGGLKSGYASFMCQHAEYDSCQVADGEF